MSELDFDYTRARKHLYSTVETLYPSDLKVQNEAKRVTATEAYPYNYRRLYFLTMKFVSLALSRIPSDKIVTVLPSLRLKDDTDPNSFKLPNTLNYVQPSHDELHNKRSMEGLLTSKNGDRTFCSQMYEIQQYKSKTLTPESIINDPTYEPNRTIAEAAKEKLLVLKHMREFEFDYTPFYAVDQTIFPLKWFHSEDYLAPNDLRENPFTIPHDAFELRLLINVYE